MLTRAQLDEMTAQDRYQRARRDDAALRERGITTKPGQSQRSTKRRGETRSTGGDDDLDEASAALLVALYLLDVEQSEERGYDPAKHARVPKGQPGGGRFMSMVDRVKKVLEEHLNGDGKGDPFDGFNREQLRKVAKARGIELTRGEDRDSIAKKLLDDLDKGGHAAAPSEPRSVRVPGQDRLDEITRGLNGQTFEYEGRRRRAYDTPFDLHLQKIVKTQGFDAKPQVVTSGDMDHAVSAGWIEVWRGVQGSETHSAAQINHDLRYGEFEPGRGVYGNGVYTSTRRVSAETYRGRDPMRGPAPGHTDYTLDDLGGDAAPDSLLRIAIDPAARIADFDELQKERLSLYAGTAPGSSPEAAVFADVGRYAAARGYDVMVVRGHSDGAFYPDDDQKGGDDYYAPSAIEAPQYVILNRSVAMIQRAEDVP